VPVVFHQAQINYLSGAVHTAAIAHNSYSGKFVSSTHFCVGCKHSSRCCRS